MKKKRKQKKGRSISAEAVKVLDALIADMPCQRDLLIEYLHRIQDHFHCLPLEQLHALAKYLNLSQTEVYEVASFYHHFDIVDVVNTAKDNQQSPPELTIRVCDSITCQMNGADDLHKMAEMWGGDLNLVKNTVRIQRVPCVGRCDKAPVVAVGNNPIENATISKIQDAVINNNIEAPKVKLLSYDEYKKQNKNNNGAYVLYTNLKKDFDQNKKEEILTQLESSGLRGLGGAGFPLSRKWRIVSNYPAPRMMAVNIDEGEPGTFKDRYYLENHPREFIEGMLIAALVVGVEKITVYIRDEYTACRLLLENELENISNDPDLDTPEIILRRGAGAYICGEESAMLESIEGKRGMPRLRPPYVAEQGLFGKPTLVHNMETLYWVRVILEKGADWFASQGRNGRKGLRSFSVSGRVNKAGVHLASAGITLNELIEEYCGGMQQEHTLYGYLPGGASGGILPSRLANIPLDFDTLQEHGCFIGSAAIIIFSDKDSARQIATNAMRFFKHESCGQCTPCRVGTEKAVTLMEAPKWNTDLMHELSTVMQDASICGLGQAAPNPMDCVIRYFSQECESEVTDND